MTPEERLQHYLHRHRTEPDQGPWERAIADMLRDALAAQTMRPLDDWHEDIGPVLWWITPVCEPPWCGDPRDNDWPGYNTHWTPLLIPDPTTAEAPSAEAST